MSGGEGAEEEADPLGSRAAGIGGGGVWAATEAAAEWRDKRAWSIVKRVWTRAVRRCKVRTYNFFRENRLTSSSAFLAPRIESSKSRSPSPDLRNDSRMELSDAGGAGWILALMREFREKTC